MRFPVWQPTNKLRSHPDPGTGVQAIMTKWHSFPLQELI